MPDLEIHKGISSERTNNNFEELHKWMDEATEYLGPNHRLERHFFTEEYKKFIEKKWGPKAVVEWLFHIAIDNLETANKFAVEIYHSAYAGIEVNFEGKEIKNCRFRKDHPNSSSFTTYEKK